MDAMLELGRALATSVAKGPQTTRSGAHRAAAKTLDSARLTAPDCNARAPSLASSRPRGRVVEECCRPFLGARACPVQTDANARCQSASPRSRTKRVKTHFSWRPKSCPGPQLACVCGCGAGDLAVFVTIDGGVQRAYAFLSRTLGSGPREAPRSPVPFALRPPAPDRTADPDSQSSLPRTGIACSGGCADPSDASLRGPCLAK